MPTKGLRFSPAPTDIWKLWAGAPNARLMVTPAKLTPGLLNNAAVPPWNGAETGSNVGAYNGPFVDARPYPFWLASS